MYLQLFSNNVQLIDLNIAFFTIPQYSTLWREER